MVIFTLTRREWGSVQMKLASMIRTLDNPFSFLRHKASNSLDSGAALIQLLGGCSHLYSKVNVKHTIKMFVTPSVYLLTSQSRQVCRTLSRCTPCDISTETLTQSEQSAPAAAWPSMGAPQLQQRMVASGCWTMKSEIGTEASRSIGLSSRPSGDAIERIVDKNVKLSKLVCLDKIFSRIYLNEEKGS